MSIRAVSLVGSLVLLTPATRQPIAQRTLFVSNEVSHDVSVVDAATNKVIATIPVGGGPEAFT